MNNAYASKGSACGTKPAWVMPGKHRLDAGFSYLEVMIATALIAISLVPALEALSTGGKGHTLHESHIEEHYHLTAKLEEVLAEPFSHLDEAASAAGSPVIASSYSDTVTLADGRTLGRKVYLSRYDGDNSDGNNNPYDGIDEGLIWVRVEVGERGLGIERLINVYE